MQYRRTVTMGVPTAWLLVAGLLVACTDGDAGRRHEPDRGPLGAVTGPPASYDRAGDVRLVSFGAVSLCSADPGDDILVEQVRYDAGPAPDVVSSWLRTVPAVAERTSGHRFQWAPMLVAGGYPPSALDDGPWRGEFTEALGDRPVSEPCAAIDDLDAARVELVTTLQVGPAGAQVDEISVDYKLDDIDYTLVVPVDFVVCGSETVPCA
jgi:hypothetical protein